MIFSVMLPLIYCYTGLLVSPNVLFLGILKLIRHTYVMCFSSPFTWVMGVVAAKETMNIFFSQKYGWKK